MSGSKINDYSIGDENIQSVMLTLDKAYKGLHQVSLTNYDNTSVSAIAAGSVVENNGALFKFDSNEAISTTDPVTSSAIVDGTVYIMLVPSGASITASYTATAPVWSDSKQGWYGVGAYANNRYLEFKLKKTGSLWSDKDKIYFHSWTYTDPIYGLLPDGSPLYSKILTFVLVSTTSVTLPHGISNAVSDKKILSVNSFRADSTTFITNEGGHPSIISWTDTTMRLQQIAPTTETHDVFIIYKR